MVLFTKDVEPDGLIRPGAEFQRFSSIEKLLDFVAYSEAYSTGRKAGIRKGWFMDGWGKMKDPSSVDLAILNEKVFGSGVRIVCPEESSTFPCNDGKTRIFPVEPVYVPVYESDSIIAGTQSKPKDLRDEIAIEAMKKLIPVLIGVTSDEYAFSLIVKKSFILADAMMEMRKK